MTKHTRDESSDALLIKPDDNGNSRATGAAASNNTAGAGLGDKLGCDTHRLKDGSTDILIMPWQHEASSQDSSKLDWEDRQRKLEYSVSFKVPMLAKTSTACFEVQKVVHFSPFVILIHSESKTPNVPYGEHFSTVNQICMTWESEGRTRIKCFTEVKFRRSIMWSSKVEAGSLEGSGGFYKEFIRQLEQLVETSRDQLLRSYETRMLVSRSVPGPFSSDVHNPVMTTAECNSGSEGPHSLLSTRPSFDSSHSATRIGVSNPVPVQESICVGPQEMSRAHSLLSQQYLRNPPLTSTAGLPRLSLDSARPTLVGTSSLVAQKSPLSTSALPLEKKSALSIFIQSMTPPAYPIVSMAPERPVGKAKVSRTFSATTGNISSVPRQMLASPPLNTETSSWLDVNVTLLVSGIGFSDHANIWK
ncbi:hypothetical protein EC991_003958 [Linnemannia zychae]|nr:hypothetical protein EC991_003958 [Linnemannia zychae]